MNTPGNLSGIARPSASIRRQFGILRPNQRDLLGILREVEEVGALAQLLEQGVAAVRTEDGRVDMRDLAHFVMSLARPSKVVAARIAAVHHHVAADVVPAIVDDAVAVHSLSLLLTEAIEMRQEPGTGAIPWRDVAAHVIAQMKRNQKK